MSYRLLLVLLIVCSLFVNVFSLFKHKSEDNTIFYKTRMYLEEYLFLCEYKFFSPHISDGYVAILLNKQNQKDYSQIPIGFNSSEMAHRLSCFYHNFYQREPIRELLAHNFACYFMSEKDSYAIFSFNLYKLPKIDSFKLGQKPYLEEVYQAILNKN